MSVGGRSRGKRRVFPARHDWRRAIHLADFGRKQKKRAQFTSRMSCRRVAGKSSELALGTAAGANTSPASIARHGCPCRRQAYSPQAAHAPTNTLFGHNQRFSTQNEQSGKGLTPFLLAPKVGAIDTPVGFLTRSPRSSRSLGFHPLRTLRTLRETITMLHAPHPPLLSFISLIYALSTSTARRSLANPAILP